MPKVLAHYRLVAPLIEASFAGSPIVFANYPDGLSKPASYHVTTVQLSVEKLLWLIHSEYAIEFFTWAPKLLDVAALRFGRIVLAAPPGVDFKRVKLAALAVRALLFDVAKLEAVPLLDGGTGMSLWIPLADAPQADELRPRLHRYATAPSRSTQISFRPHSTRTTMAASTCTYRATLPATTAGFPIVCVRRS